MGVPINNVPRRVVYAASGTGPYAFTFEILANTDIAVYRDDALLTLTTDYTVTIAANGTGSITLTAAPTGATQIAIVGNRSIQRLSDFVTGGDLFANTINNELDQQTIFSQQNAEGLGRALQAPQTDPTTINMTLPRAALRAGKALGFDANGNPTIADTIGTNRGNWAASTLYYVRDIVKDTSNSNIWQCLVQHTSSGSQPISTNTDAAKWFLMVDAAAAATSASNAASSESAAATSASNASTSASGASTSATNAESSATAAAASATSASNSATSAAASFDSFDDRYLGPKTSNPTVDNDGNALLTGALYFNSTASEMRVWNGSAWVASYLPATGYVAKGGDTMTGPLRIDAKLSLGAAAQTDAQIRIANAMTGATTQFGVVNDGTLQSDVTGIGVYFRTVLRTQAAAFTLGSLTHYQAAQATLGAGSAVTTQYGFVADSSMTGATSNYGFRGALAAGTGRYNLYMDGTADNYLNGNLGIGVTSPQAVFDLAGDYREGVVTANTGTAYTISLATGTVQILTLTGNCTFTFPTLTAGESFTLLLRQDGTGSRTVTWPAAVRWPGGTAPTITSTASRTDKYVFTCDGTRWYGSNAGQNYSA